MNMKTVLIFLNFIASLYFRFFTLNLLKTEIICHPINIMHIYLICCKSVYFNCKKYQSAKMFLMFQIPCTKGRKYSTFYTLNDVRQCLNSCSFFSFEIHACRILFNITVVGSQTLGLGNIKKASIHAKRKNVLVNNAESY